MPTSLSHSKPRDVIISLLAALPTLVSALMPCPDCRSTDCGAQCRAFPPPSKRSRGALASAAASGNSALLEMLEDDFRWQLEDNPEYASQCGIHDFDNRLQDLSPSAFERRKTHAEAQLAQLTQIESTASLDERGKLLASMARDDLSAEAKALSLGCHYFAVNSIGIGGVHHNFVETLQWAKHESAEDHAKFVARLEAFPGQVESYKSLLSEGRARGLVASKAMLRQAVEQVTANADEPKELRERIAKLGDAVLRARAETALTAYVGVLRGLASFLDEYKTHAARDTVGCVGLARDATVGQAIYAHALAYHTTTSMTADEVHALGLEEVARIGKRMEAEVYAPLGLTGPSAAADFAALVEKQRATHFYDSADAVIEGYRDVCARIEAQLPKFFHPSSRPRATLDIVPKDSPTAPAAYYLAGTPDGARPGRFLVNVANVRERPKYEMAALALHEASPSAGAFERHLTVINHSSPPLRPRCPCALR